MKIAGYDASKRPVGKCVIPRGDEQPPVVLRVIALPLGHEEKILEFFPAPIPPEKPRIKSQPTTPGAGPIFFRDPQTGKLEYAPDKGDPDYLKLVRRQNRGNAGFFIFHGLQEDGNVSFDTDKALLKDKPEAFYLAVYEEMISLGMSAGDVMLIIEKIMEVSNFNKETIARAREDFTSGERTAK